MHYKTVKDNTCLQEYYKNYPNWFIRFKKTVYLQVYDVQRRVTCEMIHIFINILVDATNIQFVSY